MSRSCADGSPSHETLLENELVRRLQSRLIPHQRQARTPAGIADVITECAIYEVKGSLTRTEIFMGIGQLLCYRYYFPGRRLILVSDRQPSAELAPCIDAAGVKILILPFCAHCRRAYADDDAILPSESAA